MFVYFYLPSNDMLDSFLKASPIVLEASPLSLHLHMHLHFNIRNVDADAQSLM